jgi:hypothetical protein
MSTPRSHSHDSRFIHPPGDRVRRGKIVSDGCMSNSRDTMTTLRLRTSGFMVALAVAAIT